MSKALRKPGSLGSLLLVMRGAPEAPVAKARSVSEVEVSPSTVTQLNEVFVPALSSSCSTSCGRAASS